MQSKKNRKRHPSEPIVTVSIILTVVHLVIVIWKHLKWTQLRQPSLIFSSITCNFRKTLCHPFHDNIKDTGGGSSPTQIVMWKWIILIVYIVTQLMYRTEAWSHEKDGQLIQYQVHPVANNSTRCFKHRLTHSKNVSLWTCTSSVLTYTRWNARPFVGFS